MWVYTGVRMGNAERRPITTTRIFDVPAILAAYAGDLVDAQGLRRRGRRDLGQDHAIAAYQSNTNARACPQVRRPCS